MEKHQINKLSPIYMISVLGSSFNKTYPFDYMADIINKIASLEEMPNPFKISFPLKKMMLKK